METLLTYEQIVKTSGVYELAEEGLRAKWIVIVSGREGTCDPLHKDCNLVFCLKDGKLQPFTSDCRLANECKFRKIEHMDYKVALFIKE